ncbi:MAG TPA: hypothetical protein VMH80_24880 [Bryobacteraceae bacterium]|nr:hypothetical protein [Bryobacteraceae bacterium]
MRILKLGSYISLIAAAGLQLTAAPTITGIANAASNIGFGPNGPIAQGAIFVIYGKGLGPANLTVAPQPFQTTSLSGTSVTVTAGTFTSNLPIYYTSDGQVAALLTSNAPTGPATFTVTYNGQASNAAGHGIAENNPGVFTVDSSGQGPGIVTYPDYSLVSSVKANPCGGPNTACGAANPGDTLILWATGLGPVSGDDASGSDLGKNMPNIPLALWLGGVRATVTYQGRSGCCVGEDQIVFTVPDSVPTGCAVPLVLQVGNEVSNTTVLPVAKGSRDCTPLNPALANAGPKFLAGGPVTFAEITLAKNINDNATGYVDKLKYSFGTITGYPSGTQPFFLSWIDDQPVGTCVAYNGIDTAEDSPPGTSFASADAGSSLTVKGPNGTQVVPVSSGESAPILAADASFFVPGDYTITGPGGADIGPFSATITFPPSPTLVSPANNATVNRADGMTITWTGGDPKGDLRLTVFGAVNPAMGIGNQAMCNAPAAPGTFTIPPYVMLALPTTQSAGFTIAPTATEVSFTATGLDAGILGVQLDGTGHGFGAGNGGLKLQ